MAQSNRWLGSASNRSPLNLPIPGLSTLPRSLLVAIALLAIPLQGQDGTGPRLTITTQPDQSVRLSWVDSANAYLLERTPSLDPGSAWQSAGLAPAQQGETWSVLLNPAARSQFYRLREAGPPAAAQITRTSPVDGETGVSVTRETIIQFSSPLSPAATLTTDRFHAEFGGRRLLSRVELSSDRRSATLFYLEELPAGSRVRVTLIADGLKDGTGEDVDVDGDGQPGGVRVLRFETAGIAALANTGVTGYVFASEKNPDGSNRPLEGVTVTVDGAEERLRAVTDATGYFRLQPSPAGRFFVHVDGRTAVGSQWPGGAYYPFVGKAWEATPGVEDNLAGGSGEVYLPLIQAGALQAVNATAETTVSFVPSVVAENPALAGVNVRIPANGLFNDAGVRGGQVGIAPVEPDRLPEPLPPGLSLPLVITLQTDGPMNFDLPVPMRFPNLPDPVTGMLLPPGAKTVLWSFNHDTGRWEPQGTATITADGLYAETDPGVGARQPGWHGVSPATLPDPLPDPWFDPWMPGAPTGSEEPESEEEDECKGLYDCDEDGCAESMEVCKDDCEKQREEMDRVNDYCPLSRPFQNLVEQVFTCPIGICPDPAWVGKFLDCREQLADAVAEFRICSSKRTASAGAAREGLQRHGGLESLALQRLLTEAAARPLDLLFGSPEFTGIEPQEADVALAVLAAISQAREQGSPAGSLINSAERASILSLPLPSNLTVALVESAITRLNAYTDGSLPAAERQAIENAQANYDSLWQALQAEGWRTPFDGGYAFDAELAQNAKGVALDSFFPRRRLYYRIENLENGFEFRGRLNRRGHFEGIAFPADAYLLIEYLDPVTLATGSAVFRSAPVGQGTPVPAAPMLVSADGPDTDGDGLTDDMERIIGTNPNQADTDGDGIPDGLEVLNGQNPLDGIATVLGPVAAIGTPGSPQEITVVDDVAVIADGPAGLALVRVSDPLRPLMLNRVNLRGAAQFVAGENGYVAVAQGAAGVALVDVRNPSRPVIVWDRTVQESTVYNIGTVALRGDLILATASTGRLLALDRATGNVLQSLPVPFSTANQRTDDMHVVGDVAYLVSRQDNDVLGAGGLATYRIEGNLVLPLGSVAANGGAWTTGSTVRRNAFVDGQVAHVGYFGGVIALDVSNPSSPQLLHRSQGQLSVIDLAANGTGLLLPLTTSGNRTRFSLSAYDLTPAGPITSFLFSLPLPTQPRALTLHRGYALVVDGVNGLTVMNYLNPDYNQTAPTLAPRLTQFPTDGPPGTTRWRIDANATDDVQVRTVEALIDGTRVAFDGSYPFELHFRAAPATATQNRSVRVVATDMSGNRREVMLPLTDTTPPRLRSVFPPLSGQAPSGSVTELSLVFDESIAPSTVTAGLVTVLNSGLDRRFGTADDQPVAVSNIRLEADGRTVTVALANALPTGLYQVTLLAGLADLSANARLEPTVWTFETGSSLGIESVSPRDDIAVPGGSFPSVTVKFRTAVSQEAFQTMTFQFVRPGLDGVLGTGDDQVVGLGLATLVTPDTVVVIPPAGVGPGVNGLRVISSLLDTSGIYRISFRNEPNEWIASGDGLWSVAGNWSHGSVWPGDLLLIPGAATRVTTADISTRLTGLVSDSALTLQRNTSVSGVARMRAPLNIEPLDILLSGGGQWDLESGMNITSTIFENQSFGLEEITVVNRGLARWLSGQIRVLNASAQWINQPSGIFQIGADATRFQSGAIASGPGGRFINLGRIEKPAGTNLVLFAGMRTQNDGRIEIGQGGLRFHDYEGAGAMVLDANAQAQFAGTVRINDGSSFVGDGDVAMGAFVGNSVFAADARVLGSYAVRGVTTQRFGNVTFLNRIDEPQASFVSIGSSTNEVLRFEASARFGHLTIQAGHTRFENPAHLDNLTFRGGLLAGNGSVRIDQTLDFDGGTFGPGGPIEVHGGLAMRPNRTMQLNGRTLRLAQEAVTQFDGTSSWTLQSAAASGRLINAGTFSKTDTGTLTVDLPFENQGLVSLGGGTMLVRLVATGSYTQTATGTTRLDGGRLSFEGTTYLHAAGRMGGVGQIAKGTSGLGTFTNAAIFQVNVPGGTTDLTNLHFTQTGQGEMQVTLGSEGTGRLNLVTSNARITLGGTLRVQLAPGFVPALGQTFEIANASILTGSFDQWVLPDLGSGRRLEIKYNPSNVVLTVVP
jgi:hypothetical protein